VPKRSLDKIERLIREYPPEGPSGSVPGPDARSWIAAQLDNAGFADAALALHARVQAVVEEVETTVLADDRRRLFYRSDFSNLVKAPDSILDRMTRDWEPRKGAPKITFATFLTQMEDLARFRIVLNFLSDVRCVCSKLEEPYKCKAEHRVRLSPAQLALYDDFALTKERLKDLIRQSPAERLSGERCYKGVFYPRSRSDVKVEVQIQTMLQEAWDKKDHFLIYEPRRRGETVNPDHGIESYAISELLYVADLTFDRLLEGARRRKRKG
jgi:ppGpp synthetase/RelA/SpoT-type nucleotidyltranferase